MKKKRTKSKSKWKPPTEWLAPIDPEEFKFCFALMGAGASGQMPIPRPRPLLIEGMGEFSLNNTPLNRGMLAVSKHLHEVYPHAAGEGPWQVMAIPFRLMSFGDFLADCFQGKHPEFEPFLRRNKDSSIDVSEALVEAGASAEFGEKGLVAASLFGITQKLFEADKAAETKS
jgi:hypothetical protein